jgi:hypothetical protein
MIIDPGRIEGTLKHAGFRLSYFSNTSGETFLARRAAPSLFEGVSVGRSTQSLTDGQNFDLVGTSVYCSIVPGRTALKGLAIAEFLPLPSCDRNGSAPIRSEDDGVRWLGELAAAAPVAATESRRRHGEALLASTAEVRETAESYMRQIPKDQNIAQCVATLRSQASNQQRDAAVEWCKQRIVVIPNGVAFYEAAALAIAIYQDEVERQVSRFVGKRADDPHDRGLMLRLQVLASHLAHEPGWEWPIST